MLTKSGTEAGLDRFHVLLGPEIMVCKSRAAGVVSKRLAVRDGERTPSRGIWYQ